MSHWGCRMMGAMGACSNCERWRSVSMVKNQGRRGETAVPKVCEVRLFMWLLEYCLCISPRCICQDYTLFVKLGSGDFQLRHTKKGYLTSIPSWEIIIHVEQPGFAAFAACNFRVWCTDHSHCYDNLWPSWSCRWQLHGKFGTIPVVFPIISKCATKISKNCKFIIPPQKFNR